MNRESGRLDCHGPTLVRKDISARNTLLYLPRHEKDYWEEDPDRYREEFVAALKEFGGEGDVMCVATSGSVIVTAHGSGYVSGDSERQGSRCIHHLFWNCEGGSPPQG